MSIEISDTPEDRDLTDQERDLAFYMLQHGNEGAADFLAQLDRARVTSKCGCGCAGVNFEVTGLPRPSGGMRLLGDFIFKRGGETYGAFIFERGGVLGGVEVYGLSGNAPDFLPDPSELERFDG
jgi:hypothetical protein